LTADDRKINEYSERLSPRIRKSATENQRKHSRLKPGVMQNSSWQIN